MHLLRIAVYALMIHSTTGYLRFVSTVTVPVM